MSISKKNRFEIMKRDGFACQYCGRKMPDVILEVDHIVPISKGGTAKQENLITACFDCNRGKGKNELGNAFFEKFDVQKEMERQKQYKKYLKVEAENQAYIETQIDKLIDQMVSSAKDKDPNGGFYIHCSQDQVRRSLRDFMKRLPMDFLETAIDRTVMRCTSNHFRYFCGICRKEIKGANNG